MNLLAEGPHACADAVLSKVRALTLPLALHVEDDGTITARNAATCKAPESRIGVYTRAVRYRDLVEDLTHIRNTLTESAARAAQPR